MAGKDRSKAQMVAGLANHRRLEMIRLLLKTPGLCVDEVAGICRIDQSTAVEHLRRLHESGMIVKKSQSRRVLLSVTKRGESFLKMIDMLWSM